jgi:GT2 family glycosyltransferase
VRGARYDGLAVIVVNFASSGLLVENLAPLGAALDGALVVVVDNFSSGAERERVRSLGVENSWLTVLADDNGGFGRGMNLGAAQALGAGAQQLLLLNPDAQIDPVSVAVLLDVVEGDPDAMVAPVIRRPDGSTWSAGSDLYLDDGRIRSTARRLPDRDVMSWVSGACVMIGADLWRRIDGFDPDYFLYWEDVDLSRRVLDAGGRLLVSDAAWAVHAEGGTQGVSAATAGAAKSTTYYYYAIRNRLLFAASNLDADQVRAWRRVSLPIAWEVLLEGGRRQLVRSPRPMMAAWRGIRDGRALSSRTAIERRRAE